MTATAPDGRERVVVAAPDAGCRPRTEGDRVLAEPITAIAVDGSGNVWFATDEDRTSPVGRMLVVDPDRRLRVVPASVGPIVEMAIGADGDLYAVERHRATPRVLRLPDAADRVADYAIADRSPGC